MPRVNPDPDTAAAFISRWASSGASERANYALFLAELCDLLDVPRPEPTKPDDADNAYVFERNVTFHHPDGSTSTGRIDLYKRACFILEAKQGVEKREAAGALAEVTKAKAKSAKKGHAQRGSAAWDEAMLKARGQAEQYARALPASEGRPPLLIVVDVGHSIELYSEFTRTGGTYIPFPDPQSHRIMLARLADPAVREMLRLAWTDPQSLDPSRRSARVTREIAEKLGRLAASLEKSGHGAEAVGTFLMRALFTMFAEDVELLPKESFVTLLRSLESRTADFVPMIEELWGRMKTGGFSTVLREKVRHFNGGLFADATALPVTDDQFALLIEASRADWRDVEPAIFGTLLERALDAHERHKLGAHYTPRAYVERLVLPTVIEPLRAEWDAAKAAAVTLDRAGKTKDAITEVQRFHRRLCEVRVLDPACGSGNFLYVTLEQLKRLEGEVLDALSRLGHEQTALDLAGFSVDPHQLLGIEVNPRAAAIAELVLWIGYLQWHFRTRGRVAPPEPIIKNFHNIENRDAVLACDHTEPVLDESGAPVTRWNGRTMKTHPVTGEEVPDDTARVPLLRYLNPRPAEWPQADFIVGNPPFIGTARMRDALGDGYTQTLRATYPDVPESADFVMYWWHKAAALVREGKTARFGFITTNSLRQTFNRRVLELHLEGQPVSIPVLRAKTPDSQDQKADPLPHSGHLPPQEINLLPHSGVLLPQEINLPPHSGHLQPQEINLPPHSGHLQPQEINPPAHSGHLQPQEINPPAHSSHLPPQEIAHRSPVWHFSPLALPPLRLHYAIPDHPWVDSADGAAVRIALTVGTTGTGEGRLAEVVEEIEMGDDAAKVTLAERPGQIHANLTAGANVGAAVPLEANQGLSNRGFCLFGAGFIVTREEAAQLGLGRIPGLEQHIREYRNGKDLTATPRGVLVIDLFGLSSDEVRDRYPEVYQWVVERVKPERDNNNRESRRVNWWIFGEPNKLLREMLRGLNRYIATVETSKHRFFQFLDASIAPDNMLVNIATDDPFYLGVLSSRVHVEWALATGGRLGVGNDPRYNKTRCFETFPFPDATEAQRARIREIAEKLDAHRKRQQALHPKLTLTDCYNVLEKLRAADGLVGTRCAGSDEMVGTRCVASDSSGGAVGAEPGTPSTDATQRVPTLELTAKERAIHEQGLVSVLRQLHDDLDAAVAEAYGLPPAATDDAILAHLCALNTTRAAEERNGHVRWLRPEFQRMKDEGGRMKTRQDALVIPEAAPLHPSSLSLHPSRLPWPKTLPDQAAAVRAALSTHATATDAAALAKHFKAAKADRVQEILETLASLGQARSVEGGKFVGV